jgi:radical SAM protein with 4Fe4S-binding SPASM domain
MKAKIQQRINLEEKRTSLEDVLPLSSPYVLMVDPSSACNFHCLFCPTGDTKLIQSTGRYQGFMKLDLFRKIIDGLELFDAPVKVLRLYKEGEPLLNPFLPEMIRYAKQSNKILRIDTTTNGTLLKPKMNRQLIESGIDQINISVNGVNDAQFSELTKAKVDFQKYVDNIRDLYENKKDCTIYIKAIYENMSSDERDLLFDIFGDICDRIYLEHLQPNWPDFHFDYINVEYTVGHYGQKLREQHVCPFIFYIMVVNSDGTVSLCVQDWAHKLVVGDVRNESLLNIWRGKEINMHRIVHLEYRRKDNPICSICPVMKHGVLDDIDKHASAIRDRYLALWAIDSNHD